MHPSEESGDVDDPEGGGGVDKGTGIGCAGLSIGYRGWLAGWLVVCMFVSFVRR